MPSSMSFPGLVPAAITALLLFTTGADAVPIVLDPAAQSVGLGETVGLDVVLFDLEGEIVSAYDLDVVYDPSVLTATHVLFTTQLGDELFFEVLSAFDLSEPGVVDLAQLSLLPDDELFALQGGDRVTVASLVFEAVGTGTSALDYTFDALNDVKGRDGAVLPLNPSGASVTVEGGPPNVVPEPRTSALVALGLLGVAWIRIAALHAAREPG